MIRISSSYGDTGSEAALFLQVLEVAHGSFILPAKNAIDKSLPRSTLVVLELLNRAVCNRARLDALGVDQMVQNALAGQLLSLGTVEKVQSGLL